MIIFIHVRLPNNYFSQKGVANKKSMKNTGISDMTIKLNAKLKVNNLRGK